MDFGKLRAPELPSVETHVAREEEGSLAPRWPSVPRVVHQPFREVKGLANLGGGGEVKRRVMVLVVVVSGVRGVEF